MRDSMIEDHEENKRHYAIRKAILHRKQLILTKTDWNEHMLNKITKQLDSVELNIFVTMLHVIQREMFLNHELNVEEDFLKEEVRLIVPLTKNSLDYYNEKWKCMWDTVPPVFMTTIKGLLEYSQSAYMEFYIEYFWKLGDKYTKRLYLQLIKWTAGIVLVGGERKHGVEYDITELQELMGATGYSKKDFIHKILSKCAEKIYPGQYKVKVIYSKRRYSKKREKVNNVAFLDTCYLSRERW